MLMHKSVISKNTGGKVWLAVASGGMCPFCPPLDPGLISALDSILQMLNSLAASALALMQNMIFCSLITNNNLYK